ncbi:MAG: HTTM domain-containing protein, partial [Flavobacteriaceae bacterium]|nr:HTTM domain-containing protein [Flavobacteriaceae bacterium]
IQDNVLWTEEGHRMSWRMMLRSKTGRSNFYVINKDSNEKKLVNLNEYLTQKQKHQVSTKPDVIWQFAQRLKNEYALKGEDVSVYVDNYISVNGRPYAKLIDPETDLAKVEWDAFKHSSWILPSNLE